MTSRLIFEYSKAWGFKHPSPWDYVFFMNNTLKQDLSWFWYYWLWTTESVDGRIANVSTVKARATVTVRQDRQMPSPVVLKVKFTAPGQLPQPVANATVKVVDPQTALMKWPVDVWFNGNRTFRAAFDTGGRVIETITLDPACRFPDRDPNDNVWPALTPPLAPGARAYQCG